MKRRTKAIVFVSSMLLTLGSLFAFVGHRHGACGMHHRYHAEMHHGGCEQTTPSQNNLEQNNN